MATYTTNVLTRNLHGRVDNIIFRQFGDKTVLSACPVFDPNKWTKAQETNRKRFREAVAWVKHIFKDPAKKKYYQSRAKGMQTAWNVAIADYMKKPEIEEIDIRNYKGIKGNTIRVRARDNYYVAGVMVTIVDAQGKLLEQGPAMQIKQGRDWIYKATKDNLSIAGSRVIVRATDSPGNVTQAFRDV